MQVNHPLSGRHQELFFLLSPRCYLVLDRLIEYQLTGKNAGTDVVTAVEAVWSSTPNQNNFWMSTENAKP